jgi:hypothetical protein
MWCKWLPLTAIVEAAGEPWITRAREAALTLEQDVEATKEEPWDKAQVAANDNVVFSAALEEYPARFLKKVGLDAKMLRRGVKQKRVSGPKTSSALPGATSRRGRP